MPRISSFVSHLVEDELSYSISRKYPFGRWFKSTVFGVSVLVLSLFTVFSFATNGYDKQLHYTSKPNATESERRWYQHKIFTWGDDSLDPKCQNTDIPVGHEFMTTNLGLRYTVKRILHFKPGSTVGQQRSSLSYHHNNLTNCEVNLIGIDLRKADMSRPSKDHLWWSWMASDANAIARCDLINEEGFFTLDFMVKYATLSDNYDYVAVDDAMTDASFWWGARLLNAYFVGTQYVMSGLLPDSNDKTPIYTTSSLVYHAGSTTSMKDVRLFNNWFYFLNSDGGIENVDNTSVDVDALYNNASYSMSRPLTEGFFFAKVFRSLILVDLGNSEAPNLLLDPDLLQYALNPGDDNFNRVADGPLAYDPERLDRWRFAALPPPGGKSSSETSVRMDEAFDKFKDQTGKLGTKPAFIYAEYICTIPERKATLAMIMFTLVANMALFQTAWGLFKYVVDQKVTWKDRTANWCEGCVESRIEFAGTEGAGRKEERLMSGASSTRELLGDVDLEDDNEPYRG